MKKDLPTYIIHYTKYMERKKVMDTLLNKEGFQNITYITEFDREDISYTDYYNSFRANHLEYQNRKHYNFHPNYPLTPGEISFTLKQKTFLQKFVVSNYEYCFLLEDDVIVDKDFISKFDYYFESLPKDFDVAFFGQGGGKRIDKSLLEDGVYWYPKSYPADRCGDSFVLNKQSATKLLGCMEQFKICFPIDQEYAFWFRELDFKVYWLEPPITVQGSQIGLYTSVQQEFNTNSHFQDMSMSVRSDLQDIIKEVNDGN